MTRSPNTALRAAVLVALLMIAFQVASKAVRDAFYLAVFPASQLPHIVIGSAILAIITAPFYAKLVSAHGPSRLLPATFAASAITLVGLWGLSSFNPKLMAILLYLHVAVLGPMIVSSFWALVSESFDARAAKRQIGWIGGFGTLGGLLGGGLLFLGPAGGAFALPALAVIHLICAPLVTYLSGPDAQAAVAAPDETPDLMGGIRRIPRDGYLVRLVVLVICASACAGLFDFAFKSALASTMGARRDLLRGFSAYYAGVSLVTFLAQVVFARPVLQRLGPAGSAAVLPASAAVAGIGAFLNPGVMGVAIARGVENVSRNSLFRSGYELLFVPLDETERRSSKTVIDVGGERAGDMLGGILVFGLLGLGAASRQAILVAAVLLACTALGAALWFRRGYMLRIEERLREAPGAGAGDSAGFGIPAPTSMALDLSQGIDLTTLTSGLDLSKLRGLTTSESSAEHKAEIDPIEAAIRSGMPARLMGAIKRYGEPDEKLVRRLLPLLARDRFAGVIVSALRDPPPALAKPLVEFMLDSSNDLAARRRVPRIVSRCESSLSLEGLFQGLRDPRFEIRVQCGRALLRAHARAVPGGFAASLDRERVMSTVLREVDVGMPVWQAQQGDQEDWGEDAALIEHVIRERGNASLAHVFTLLALVLPREPLERAVRGIQSGDRMQRGLALEYLESVLPSEVRVRLWPFLEAEARSRERVSERSVEDMIAANESIVISLDELRKMEAMAREAQAELEKRQGEKPAD